MRSATGVPVHCTSGAPLAGLSSRLLFAYGDTLANAMPVFLPPPPLLLPSSRRVRVSLCASVCLPPGRQRQAYPQHSRTTGPCTKSCLSRIQLLPSKAVMKARCVLLTPFGSSRRVYAPCVTGCVRRRDQQRCSASACESTTASFASISVVCVFLFLLRVNF